MPKLEKVLHGDLDKIEGKITHGIVSICSMTTKRDTWTTKIGDVTCRLVVFEQHARKVYRGEDWQNQPHYTLSLNLVDTGEEIRVCGITSGSAQDMYFIPDSGAEYGLFEALSIIMDMWDSLA